MPHKVVLPHTRRGHKKLYDELDEMDMSLTTAETLLENAMIKAEEIAQQGFDRIEVIYSDQSSTWIDNWNADTKLTHWLGIVSKEKHVTKVHRRMKSISDRLNDGIKVRLRARKERTHVAQSAGWFAEPKLFKAFPTLLSPSFSEGDRAGIVIHELAHLWFRHPRLNGQEINTRGLAVTLAESDPKKARRSPENYQQYCFSFINRP